MTFASRLNPKARRSGWLWLLVGVLLLRAAVPLLASASALLQGVAVGEVCAVYGVVLPAAATPAAAEHAQHAQAAEHAAHTAQAHHDHHAEHGSGGGEHARHATEHCALTALTALCTATPAASADVQAHGASTLRLAQPPQALVGDPAARWQAQLQHGPPRQA